MKVIFSYKKGKLSLTLPHHNLCIVHCLLVSQLSWNHILYSATPCPTGLVLDLLSVKREEARLEASLPVNDMTSTVGFSPSRWFLILTISLYWFNVLRKTFGFWRYQLGQNCFSPLVTYPECHYLCNIGFEKWSKEHYIILRGPEGKFLWTQQ